MRDKLLQLLKKDSFVSGEQLATNLGVSRTAIWKHINILKDLGYDIQSVKNKGYKLVSRPDIPIPEEITPDFNTKLIGKKIHYLPSISSTNEYAKKLINDNTEEGTVIISDIQTHGRGRKDRNWSSPKGGLWFSIILYPHMPPQKAMMVTMASSIAIAEAIQKVTNIKPVIKWPNDLLIKNKKVCGILTELNAEMDRINYIIVGIGINVNNEIDMDLNKIATSLKQEKKSLISRVKLLKMILKKFDKYYENLVLREYKIIRNNWLSYSNIIGKNVIVKEEKTTYKGKVTDIDKDGYLILETISGPTRILSGDVEYIL